MNYQKQLELVYDLAVEDLYEWKTKKGLISFYTYLKTKPSVVRALSSIGICLDEEIKAVKNLTYKTNRVWWGDTNLLNPEHLCYVYQDEVASYFGYEPLTVKVARHLGKYSLEYLNEESDKFFAEKKAKEEAEKAKKEERRIRRSKK
tara:strand:- start:583 stop:1023 length:441 start_codon:yes stop_codon:yes gene_type:complete